MIKNIMLCLLLVFVVFPVSFLYFIFWMFKTFFCRILWVFFACLGRPRDFAVRCKSGRTSEIHHLCVFGCFFNNRFIPGDDFEAFPLFN